MACITSFSRRLLSARLPLDRSACHRAMQISMPPCHADMEIAKAIEAVKSQISEPGFEPGTCGLWAHHASRCATLNSSVEPFLCTRVRCDLHGQFFIINNLLMLT
jgi:hypothetical protein